MLDRFLEHLDDAGLLSDRRPCLLAVSGGIDSIVMADLFRKANLPFAIAHVNYRLRAEESDADEAFVQNLAKQFDVPFHLHRPDPLHNEDGNLQYNAREIRYAFFERTAREHEYARIATAHHHDDNIETFFIQLLRGAGLKGWEGIPVKRGKIIRPLLFATRKELEAYAREQSLHWREDSSNAQDGYLRNRIRHHLLPLLEAEQANFRENFKLNFRHFAEMRLLAGEGLQAFVQDHIRADHRSQTLSIDTLNAFSAPLSLLRHWLEPCGFTAGDVRNIFERLDSATGSQFLSPTHQVTIDRGTLRLTLRDVLSMTEQEIDNLDSQVAGLEIELLEGKVSPDSDRFTAWLDYDRLQFPLRWRRWQAGDRIVPLGMNGGKNISDLLIDEKIPLDAKSAVRVLVSGDEIVWVAGLRISQHFCLTEQTVRTLRIRCHPGTFV